MREGQAESEEIGDRTWKGFLNYTDISGGEKRKNRKIMVVGQWKGFRRSGSRMVMVWR